MPLAAPKLKAKMKASIIAGLTKEFPEVVGAPGPAAANFEKIAEAISEIALDIVQAMQSDAQVIVTGITPGPGATTGTIV